MEGFVLRKYPHVSSQEELRNEAGRAARRAHWFAEGYRARHPQITVGGPTNMFLKGLENGNFWSALGFVDGSYNELRDLGDFWLSGCLPVPEEEKAKERQQSRERAQKLFGQWELQEILNIVVDLALLVPYDSSCPGTYKGHSILHRELVQKPDSMFREAVTKDFEKHLNNGRFWEELPDMHTCLNFGISYRRVADVLLNHFEELDLNFARRGYDIFLRNSGGNKGEQSGLVFDLEMLPKEAIERYGQFMKSLDDRKEEISLKTSELEKVIAPYAVELISEDKEDSHSFRKTGEFKQKLKEPFLVAYLANSSCVKDALAHHLMLDAFYGHHPESIMDVLASLPGPREMVERIVGRTSCPQYGMPDLEKRLNEQGYSLVSFLNVN